MLKNVFTIGALGALFTVTACVGEVAPEEEVIEGDEEALVTNAYDACASILADGLRDKFLASKSQMTAGVLTEWKCQEYNRSREVDTDYWGYGVVNGDAAEEIASKTCESRQTPYTASSFTTWALAEVANQGVVNAWRECMRDRSEGFFCEPVPEGGLIQFNIDWKTNGPRELDLSWDTLRNVRAESRLPTQILTEGRRGYDFAITNPNAQAAVRVNAEGDAGAFTCNVVVNPKPKPLPAPKPSTEFDVIVRVQDRGEVTGDSGKWVGTKGLEKRVDRFEVQLGTYWPKCLKLKYKAHIQDHGDTSYVYAPRALGNTGKRIEGLAFETAGECGDDYTVEYSCHIQSHGDMGPFQDGEYCGTRDKEKRLEAVKVVVKKK